MDEISIETMIERAVERAIARQLAPVLAKLDVIVAASPPVFVDVEVAAERLGTTGVTVRRWCAKGKIPAKRFGRSWRIDLAALRPVPASEINRLAREARR